MCVFFSFFSPFSFADHMLLAKINFGQKILSYYLFFFFSLSLYVLNFCEVFYWGASIDYDVGCLMKIGEKPFASLWGRVKATELVVDLTQMINLFSLFECLLENSVNNCMSIKICIRTARFLQYS